MYIQGRWNYCQYIYFVCDIVHLVNVPLLELLQDVIYFALN